MFRHGNYKRIHTLSIEKPTEITEFLADYCKNQGVCTAQISGIGAIRKLVFAYYDFIKKKYLETTVEENLEMVSLLGNVSMKDDVAFPHMHVIAGKQDGTLIGGHLSPGTIVYPGEIIIQELEGEELERHLDEETGLYLWHSKE